MLGRMAQPAAAPSNSSTNQVLTVPNALTAVRLSCLPLLSRLLAKPDRRGRLAAAVLLGALGATDGLDGYVARRFDQVSSLGKVADPLVDRLLLLTAIRGAISARAIPRWLIAVLLGRELAVVGGGLALAVAGARRVEVSHDGKAGTFGMMVALPLFLMSSAPFRWSRGARRLAWVATIGGQFFAWKALAGYVPQALAAAGARDRREEPGPVPAE